MKIENLEIIKPSKCLLCLVERTCIFLRAGDCDFLCQNKLAEVQLVQRNMSKRSQRNFHQSLVLALMSSAFCLRLGTTVQAFSAYSTAATSASRMVNTARAAAASSTTPRNRIPSSSSGLSKARPRQFLRPRALPCSRLASSASDASIPRSPGAGAAFRAADNLGGGAEEVGQQQVGRHVSRTACFYCSSCCPQCTATGGWHRLPFKPIPLHNAVAQSVLLFHL